MSEQHGLLFDRVIAPMERSAFLSEFWGKSFLRIDGQPGRFASLLPWGELSSLLERHELSPPRLRLFRGGKSVDPGRFLHGTDRTQRLKAAGLITSLSEGATLVVDDVDALSAGVRELAEAFEEVLLTGTSVNLYASWRNQSGFDLHWDTQDTMILQLSGRKHWKVYRPTRLHPLKPDVEDAPRPTEEPVWEGIMEDGAMIHLPRGWWHVAAPLDEPSLHLTVTVVPPDGADLLRWCVERSKRHAEVRRNVPSRASDVEQGQYLSRLRELMMESLTDDVLQRFLEDWEARIPLRPHVRLPQAPADAREPIDAATRIRLTSARRLSFERDGTNGKASFRANDVRWQCSPALVPALATLRGTVSRSVRQLCDALADPDASRELQMFLTALAMQGVVWTERGEAG
jgi:ribosomal protein L16 Arg81 hydroxylase